MTHDEKINYLRMSLNICSFQIKQQDIDLILTMYEMILLKKGDATIQDTLKIENQVKEKYKAKL
jgi:hypothetical protein